MQTDSITSLGWGGPSVGWRDQTSAAQFERRRQEFTHSFHGRLVRRLIEADMRAVLDARIVKRVDGTGLGIKHLAVVAFPQRAVAGRLRLEKLNRRRGRPVVGVKGVGIFGQRDVDARGLQALDIGAARSDRDIVVGNAVEEALPTTMS